MNAIPHNYTWACGQTFEWDTSDNEDKFEKNIADHRTKKLLESYGWIGQTITYQFNSHGFRTKEFDQSSVVCFGCSFTMGTGLPAEHTWPAQLQQLTGHSVINLAHAGSSNDTAVRMAIHYLPELKPQYALWLQTDRHRLEILDDSSRRATNLIANDTSNIHFGRDNFVKQWFASDSNQQLNLEKNTRAFRNLCNELNIVCIILPRNAVVKVDLARDLLHPGILSNLAMAKQFQSLM